MTNKDYINAAVARETRGSCGKDSTKLMTRQDQRLEMNLKLRGTLPSLLP